MWQVRAESGRRPLSGQLDDREQHEHKSRDGTDALQPAEERFVRLPDLEKPDCEERQGKYGQICPLPSVECALHRIAAHSITNHTLAARIVPAARPNFTPGSSVGSS